MSENDRYQEGEIPLALNVNKERGIADALVHLHQLERELEVSLEAIASTLVQKKQAVDKALEDQKLASEEAKRFFQRFQHNMKRESVDDFISDAYWNKLMLITDMTEMLGLKAGSQLASRVRPKSVYVKRCEVCDVEMKEVLARSRSERDTLLRERRVAMELSKKGRQRESIICRSCYGRQLG